jgi:hypothetical protein
MSTAFTLELLPKSHPIGPFADRNAHISNELGAHNTSTQRLSAITHHTSMSFSRKNTILKTHNDSASK